MISKMPPPYPMPLLSTPKIYSLLIWTILLFIIFPISSFSLLSITRTLVEWQLFSSNSFHLSLTFILDPLGLIFSSTVLFISANIIQFSASYIKEDPFIKRFLHLVLLFILSINLLIFIPNLIILLIGWDGLGITSFILVIYYHNPKSLAAGIITALTNRIGDAIILLAIAWSLNQGHWNILHIKYSPSSYILTLLILVAALTKRAQIPFSRWLPAAIAAPTPVSALVHSSTLVTAGVFLLLRFYPFLHKFQFFNKTLLIISTITIFIAGIAALTETDIKKIIALSTLSQLGVIIARLGLNLPSLTFFHLITHAIFKALLFICAGALINIFSHAQDLRFIGFLLNQTPLLSSAIISARLALCGSPFLSGFYSKDIIIEIILFNPINSLIFILFFIATSFTSAYSVRLLASVIWGPFLSSPLHSINNIDSRINIPSINLSVIAIGGGRLINWSIILPSQEPFLSESIKSIPIIAAILGLILIIIFSFSQPTTIKRSFIIIPLLNYRNCIIWFITPLSSQFMIKQPLLISHIFLKTRDQGWNEYLGGQGIYISSSYFSASVIKWQDNIISTHLFLVLLTLLPLIFIY